MNHTETIRKVLETHRIETERAEFAQDRPGFTQKCAGCTWIGWHHTAHLAETIDLAIMVEKQQTYAEHFAKALKAARPDKDPS